MTGGYDVTVIRVHVTSSHLLTSEGANESVHPDSLQPMDDIRIVPSC